MEKKLRDSKLIKFPEIQGIVIKEIKRYIFENDSSYTKISLMTDVSKARFTEMKKIGKDSLGKEYYIYPLSESVLEPLIGREIVPLTKIADQIDITDPKKAQWLEEQKMFQDIRYLKAKGYPVKDKIEEMKKEAGLE